MINVASSISSIVANGPPPSAPELSSTAPTISGSICTPPGMATSVRGGVFHDNVSKLLQLPQMGVHSAWILWQLSQIHCGPRDTVNARANQPLTTVSDAPSPRSIAAIKVTERAVGSFSTRSPNARRAAGKSSSAICSSDFSILVSGWSGCDLVSAAKRLIRSAGFSSGAIAAKAAARSGWGCTLHALASRRAALRGLFFSI